jgi:hypothetical protein
VAERHELRRVQPGDRKPTDGEDGLVQEEKCERSFGPNWGDVLLKNTGLRKDWNVNFRSAERLWTVEEKTEKTLLTRRKQRAQTKAPQINGLRRPIWSRKKTGMNENIQYVSPRPAPTWRAVL